MTATSEAPEPAPPPRLSMVAVVVHPNGGSQVGVIAKRTYRVVGQRCVVDDEQVPLVEAQRFSEDKAALLHDFDGVLNRAEVDVVVEGHARRLRASAPSFELRVRVGQLDRKLIVWGDRRCYRDAYGREDSANKGRCFAASIADRRDYVNRAPLSPVTSATALPRSGGIQSNASP